MKSAKESREIAIENHKLMHELKIDGNNLSAVLDVEELFLSAQDGEAHR